MIDRKGSYEGMFENGKKKGKGTEELIDGIKYEGLWSNDMKNGIGEMT